MTPSPDLFTSDALPFRLDGTNEEAVVAVHGLTGLPGHFRPLASALNEHGYTVNVPLLAGHGVDADHLATATSDEWERSVVDAVRAVADHRRVHVMGISLGGLLAVLAAPRTAASSVTTINAPIVLRTGRTLLQLLPVSIAERFADGAPGPSLDPAVEHLWQILPGYDAARGELERRLARELEKTLVRTYRTARRLRRPSLVIQSRMDEVVDPRSARILANALGPSCRTIWIEHGTHLVLLDHSRDEVSAAVLSGLTIDV